MTGSGGCRRGESMVRVTEYWICWGEGKGLTRNGIFGEREEGVTCNGVLRVGERSKVRVRQRMRGSVGRPVAQGTLEVDKEDMSDIAS